MTYSSEMNPQIGKKWFVFFTAVRPWLGCISLLIPLADILQNANVYFSHIGMLFSLITNIVLVVLWVFTALKSDENYYDFVRFVNGVLIYEVCNSAFQQGVQQYYTNGNNLIEASIIAGIVGLGMYFIWYRPNIKYFKRRLVQIPSPITSSQQSAHNIASSNQPLHICLSDNNEQANTSKYGGTPLSDLRLDTECASTTVPRSSSHAQSTFTSVSTTTKPVKYCSRCGRVIDPSSKKCTGCGKQYFKGFKLSTVLLIMVLLLSLTGNYLLYVANNDLKAEVASLEKTHKDLELEKSTLASNIKSLKEDKTDLQLQLYENSSKIYFYDKYIVFVVEGDKKYYHHYDCEEFQSCESFWAYNIEAAKDKKYKPCSSCCD